MDPNGIITTVAGRGSASGAFTPGVIATNTYLQIDKAVVVDANDNVLLSDGNRVRKVDSRGIFSTVAGMGESPGRYFGDGGAATNATLNLSGFLALDGSGNLFISDMLNQRVRKVTFADHPTFVVDKATARNARNYEVVVTGASGSITSTVAVLTVIGPPEITRQPVGLTAAAGSGATLSVSAVGPEPLSYQWLVEGAPLRDQTNSVLPLPKAELASAGGYHAVIANLHGSVTSRVAVLEVGSVPTVVTPPASRTVVTGGNAAFTMAVSGTGPSSYDWRLNGTRLPNSTTVAGNGTDGYSGAGGAATNAALSFGYGRSLAVDAWGNLFIVDGNHNRIRKVGTDGIITTVAGTGYASSTGAGGYSGDNGTATNARLNFPSSLALDRLGNLIIADSANGRIRKVATDGIITTVAGRSGNGPSPDGVLATSAYLTAPKALVVDGSGNLFFAEMYAVRKVGTNRIITTVAGYRGSVAGYGGDGGAATIAALGEISGLCLDGLYSMGSHLRF